MKQFNITVNGKVYEVVVEEVGGVSAPKAVTTPVPAVAAPAPKAAPAPAPAPAPAAATPAAPVSSKSVTAPMPGTVLKILVNEGDTVKTGDVLLILEAMKMENEIMADGDGVVAKVHTTVGASVNSGDALIEFQ